LVKEYTKVLEVMRVDGSKPLNMHQLHEVMKSMQFVRTDKVSDQHPENSLLYETFDVLTVCGERGVRIKNLAIFILALMGIMEGSDVSTTKTTLRERDLNANSMQPLIASNFSGLINQHGWLQLAKERGMKLHKYF